MRRITKKEIVRHLKSIERDANMIIKDIIHIIKLYDSFLATANTKSFEERLSNKVWKIAEKYMMVEKSLKKLMTKEELDAFKLGVVVGKFKTISMIVYSLGIQEGS